MAVILGPRRQSVSRADCAGASNPMLPESSSCKQSPSARVPILMLTTESQAEKKDAGSKAGATGWIVKPSTPTNCSPSFKSSSNNPTS